MKKETVTITMTNDQGGETVHTLTLIPEGENGQKITVDYRVNEEVHNSEDRPEGGQRGDEPHFLLLEAAKVFGIAWHEWCDNGGMVSPLRQAMFISNLEANETAVIGDRHDG